MNSREIQRKYAQKADAVNTAIKDLGLPLHENYTTAEVEDIMKKIKENNPTNVKDALVQVIKKLDTLIDELRLSRQLEE